MSNKKDLFMEIATMVCLNFDVEKDGEQVLPSELSQYMSDVNDLALAFEHSKAS